MPPEDYSQLVALAPLVLTSAILFWARLASDYLRRKLGDLRGADSYGRNRFSTCIPVCEAEATLTAASFLLRIGPPIPPVLRCDLIADGRLEGLALAPLNKGVQLTTNSWVSLNPVASWRRDAVAWR
jgi:hypothetical protein